ncbi:MAG: glycoside hydrolase family 3 protein [Rhodobacter sp.]|uniref:glycoside hydrolase family 3 N-terminal domain-containing protein n=1 Tax=Pararhodobacter sp. TaxID=2127056 RepID=UPI001D60CFB8|nr:glycoside hydrolase family 3 N-terminal domain-containing protein [Pararhodobacter sp.]MCB1345241.1 glycoside hydrolase family 3 protein [Paracoccaceae bacterium]MCC0074854.1 glycoside hydrolase family 3 protein [Rhodobacter sp.]HPD90854.1 glycoside hydrolase family 3 N-terminal domain-containing protein [Pararhodobacter sp.]
MTGATILGCAGPVLSRDEAAFFRQADPWGFILFRRNVLDAAQLRALTGALRDAVGRDAPVFMDQEGGTVQRLRPPLARDWPDACAQRGDAAAIRLRHRLMAAELRAVGVDGNCAPVIDVAGPDTHPFLRRRVWSDDPADVAAKARAAAEGLLAGGVLPVLKHLPGHGAANADSHLTLPRCTQPLDALVARDFAPVRALADLPLGMTGHMVIEALDPETPATLSPVVLRYLRETLGFGGLLMTDDLSMNALPGTLPDRAARAIAAGCDLVLHCSGDLAEMEGVVAASGALGAPWRAETALAARRVPAPIDIAAATAELDRLSNPQV